jgi:hypothetical protein
VAAELVDLWNTSFFASRGVEVILFKGHERRSGSYVGQIDGNLPGFDSDSDSSGSLSSSDSSGLDDDKYGRRRPRLLRGHVPRLEAKEGRAQG